MLNIVPFGAASMEKRVFKAFPHISLCKTITFRDKPYLTLRISFEQIGISLP